MSAPELVSPFAKLRPLTLAPSLPPMVPIVWGGDPDAFRPPGFETISKPIRLSFMKTWHANHLGEAADVIPDVMPATASSWLPAGVKHQVKLGGKFKYEQEAAAKKKAAEAAAEAEAKKAAEKGSNKKKGKDAKNAKKAKAKAGPAGPKDQPLSKEAVPEPSKAQRVDPSPEQLDAAALRLQCLARQRAARDRARQQRFLMTKKKAQAQIASTFRGHLARTGRAEITPKINVAEILEKAREKKRRQEKKQKKSVPPPVAVESKEETPRANKDLVLPCIVSRVKYLDPLAKDLDLRHCCLGRSGSPKLIEIVSRLHSLERIELLGNYIGSKGLKLVVEVLEQQKDLKEVGLSWNGIGDDGCHFLASLLGTHDMLQKLDLRHNRIGDLGCEILATSVKDHLSLTEVDLRDNSILDSGARFMISALSKTQTVDMTNNPVSPAKLEEIAANVAALETLKASTGNAKGGRRKVSSSNISPLSATPKSKK